MNILIIADLVTFSGVGNYIKLICNGLRQRQNRVILVSPQNDLHIGENDGIIYEKIESINKNPINCIKNLKKLNKIIKENKVDIIHANHRLSAFLISLYNKFYEHIPTVWTAHTVPYPMNMVKKLFGYYGDRSIAISTEAKIFMQSELNISSDKIDLIYNGVDTKELKLLTKEEKEILLHKYGVSKEKLVFCIHGRIDEVKGIDIVVKAVSLLTKQELEKFVIIVSGKTDNKYYQELIKLIECFHLENNFRFVGWKAAREVLGVSSLMLAPSRREGFPLNCIEAFFMKVPTIRTKVGGYLDMKECCVGIECEDVQNMAELLKNFIANKNVYEDMVNYAYDYSYENFTIDKMIEKLTTTYNKAIYNREEHVSI